MSAPVDLNLSPGNPEYTSLSNAIEIIEQDEAKVFQLMKSLGDKKIDTAYRFGTQLNSQLFYLKYLHDDIWMNRTRQTYNLFLSTFLQYMAERVEAMAKFKQLSNLE